MSALSRREFVASLALVGHAAPALAAASVAPSSAIDPQPIHFDSDGLIVHANNDGGDTAQREGWYWFGVWIRQHVLEDPWPVQRKLTFQQVLELLEPGRDGVFYRHPRLKPWNDPFDKGFGFSRDQMVPLVAAMGVWGEHAALRRLWNALPQDPVGGTKHTFNGEWLSVPLIGKAVHTGDLVVRSTINHFRRAWNEDPMPASDGNGPDGESDLFENSALRVGLATDPDNTGDDLNLIVMLLLATLRFPSQCDRRLPLRCTSEAVRLYAKNRPVSYGSFLGAYRAHHGSEALVDDAEFRRRLDAGRKANWPTDASRVFGAVKWYHRAKTGANPQLADLYQPIIRKYLE